MSDPHEFAVRVQALDGQWETLGADRYRGVHPEALQFASNEWGPDTCSFTLRRDPGALHPDLAAFTPVEVEVAGVTCWDGRIKETPSQEGDDPIISVQCEGWQYHLDDDVYQANYVHTRMSDFVDVRSIVTADLTKHRAFGQVSAGDGAITLMIPAGATQAAGDVVGAVLDLGEGGSCIRAVVAATSSNNTTACKLYVAGHDTPYWNADSTIEYYVNGITNNTFSSSTFSGTITRARRYVTILNFGANPSTPAADTWFGIQAIQLFASTTYESGDASVLTADLVVRDALSRSAFLSDTTGVQAGAFSIPEFAMAAPQSLREVLSAVNAYENYDLRVQVGRRVIFAPRNTAPQFEIGTWSGADFQDASLGSGSDVYNRVLVQGTGPDGAQLQVERHSTAEVDPGLAQFANPSATVDAANWTATSGTITRTTSVFDSSPAAFILTTDGSGNVIVVSGSVTQPLVRRARYRFKFALYTASLSGVLTGSFVVFAQSDTGAALAQHTLTDTELFPTGVWRDVAFDWTCPATAAGYRIAISGHGNTSTAIAAVDSFVFSRLVGTIPDRLAFIRTTILPVQSALTSTSGARIGDLWLAAHQTQPFRGTFKAMLGGVRRLIGGSLVHPAHLGLGMGGYVRCAHRADPDTGGWGRDGRIASVGYDHDSLTANVALDENRAGLEALLSRLAIVTGQK